MLSSSYPINGNEERLQRILDTMAEGVTIIDNNAQIVYVNAMAQKILNLTETEIKGRTFYDPLWKNQRIDGSMLLPEEHPMAIVMAKGKAVYDQEIAIQPADKERLYISINAAPMFDHEGKLDGGICTFMDVTQRRKLMQHMDEFISIASHELKTPVTSLKGYLQLMDRVIENPSPELLARLVKQSNKSLKKLTVLIDDLLNTSRIAQGQLMLHKTNFVLADMINECCNHVRNAGTHEIIFQGDLHLEVYADEHQIDQVIVNFVNNAVKYAPYSKRIVIKAEQEGGFIKISVIDKGPGISPEKINYLFERYYRTDYTGNQFSGLGLGLYISAEIIKKHGGRIGVDSQLGKGSSFWFTLPLQ